MHQFTGLYLFAHLVRRWEQGAVKGEVIQSLHSDTSGVNQDIPVSVHGYTGHLMSGGAVPHRMNTSLQERALPGFLQGAGVPSGVFGQTQAFTLKALRS